MPSICPLELPEILQSVANQTSERSLPACALVSKAWYQVFNPHLWKDINLSEKRPNPPEAIQRHCHLVRTLEITCQPKQEHAALRFPNLASLTVKNSLQDLDITQLVTEHSTLSRLDLNFIKSGLQPSLPLWKKLLELRNLKDLSISNISIGEKNINAFWQLCTQLERLECYWISIPHRGLLSSMEFPRMKEINLWEEIPVYLELMRRCTGLEILTWSSWEGLDGGFVPGFVQLASSGTWPELESLTLFPFAITNEETFKIISSMRRITLLSIDGKGSLFAADTIVQLRPHFHSIRELDLAFNRGLTSAMAQEILSSCPLLVKFSVPQLKAIDVAEGNPWVCFGIQELSACIYFDPATIKEVQPLVLDQLSRLTRLEELKLGHPTEAVFQKAMDLRLESGLGKLSTLRRLRYIRFTNTRQKMGEKEIEWILEHWTSLEEILGVLNPYNPGICKALMERLESHGISIQTRFQ
ncbi:hypothetical protein BGZ65_011779 [Modicella reniformis]|uniref:F-box domain-containing protein n=1 Tax=Modicella reniformis TaxID=1440133 RepID=A0A9P6IM78_9FUNG|nr:hypothetical protein BGZ65_011779 [Modicella reniformis]